MAYKALYRTYRPTTFEEVAGQQHIVRTIKNALATGKIAHAYLFAGPRGTGKTTMAKLLAKALNCEDGIGNQCNECKNCRAIIDGTHPDVLEIDAASNNGVDQIRDLIDKVKYGTILGRYKVYIIDEVHMMTPGAFNALLKTLEEPPEHVVFILATTEPHKILPTILSRCQRYDFSKVSENDIKDRIKIILENEEIEYNEEAIDLIVSLADGGMRDALSILDQVIAYSGSHLNVDDVLDIFALESKEEKMGLITSIINGNVSDVLGRLNAYVGRGTDIKRLTNDLLMILKDVLIYQSSRKKEFLETINEFDAQGLAKVLNKKSVIEMIDVLMNALKEYKNVTAITPLFEITLLKLCSINAGEKTPVVEEETVFVKPVVQQPAIQRVEKPVESKPEPVQVAVAPVEEVRQPIQEEQLDLFAEPEPAAPIVLSDDVLVLKGSEGDTSFAIDDDLMLKVMVTGKKDIKNNLLDNWKEIKKMMAHPILGKAATLLIDGHPLVASQKVLVIEYQLNSVAEKINLKENQKDLQDVISNAFGKKMFIYGVSRNESIRLQKNYMDLFQVNKLPKAIDVTLEFTGE